MSRYFNSFMDDSSEDLEHSWGTSPKAKAREKEYNHWYYQKHKDEIAAIRKQRSAAANSYKQAEKSYDDARRYGALAGTMRVRLSGGTVSNVYKDPNGYYRGKITYGYPVRINGQARDMMNNAKIKFEKMSKESDLKSRELRRQAARQKYSAKVEANRIRQDIKNPKVRDLVEFYLDTTVAKAKKSASKAINKAKKYTTKAMSTADKYATKAMSTAEKSAKKYATKAMSTAEKSARKAKKYATKAMSSAEKYATKTVKSVANKAKKYVKE